ncbi:MAG: hypothetical protein ACD_57C00211G0006 [uncultured bacterium]|uniref:Prolipoprotein diacylglyceryl transferase n=1 Tax=Candidatus Curtissbacteria bacterium RIFOXYA1_FULL_41_14 TaxID=1797737 RepID=A0A1F5HCX4_9BACT|nr:MAG: hypothetical protein ACD_57C00211G0006 [uncultured bacterium]KKR56484.1 MAG: Prolipoprotein diacylglyceryl transferase [Candidatus Curtissbacteria bacterium GW2011_GWB1_40_28]KKR61074.1 MAG: Prolipoprotein diacylglyceryl transferase [Candidatus Curtissbacteria bacterium GW2011_GWA2_40_31]KKR61953.1 MAG: Prolipoprotein diacylglyceryl transferase [Microgenomates group bacterium GW2011_GWC1_40_35]KKR77112.1 MAG: Prolipoprotein diacylglyceryl transferase [Candidatus Curtissbacteria bacteriu
MIDPSVAKLIVVPIAILLASFLFWRAGRRELFESSLLFDFLIVSFIGSLIFARVFDFLLFPDIYHWSLKRLIFVNLYGSFNLWGALLGAIILGQIYAKLAKVNFWQIFDLGVAPIVFAAIFISASQVIDNFLLKREIGFSLYYFICYFLIFWFLKRLESKKRHHGFFFCFFLTLVSILNFLPLVLKDLGQSFIVAPFFIFGVVAWYRLAKRKVRADLKMIVAVCLLILLKTQRILTSVREADSFSRSIVLSPLVLAKSLAVGVKLLGREIIFSLWGLVEVFRGRK